MVAMVREAVATIKKSAIQANELHATLSSATSAQTMNQIVRWINTKEEHADKIIHTISSYCLCQRVKPEIFASELDYTNALKAHHAVMVCAMKAKQSVDDAVIHNLEHAVDDFAKMYIK
jgi:hypothetical protein